MCLDSYDDIPIRSWPLFQAKGVMRELINELQAVKAS